MKLFLSLTLLISLSTLLLVSCQNTRQAETDTKEAMLIWSGEYMVDGCGFEVLINGNRYKPENEKDIPETFKVEGETPVLIEFEMLGRQLDIRCGLSTQSRAMEAIRVISVRKRS